MVSRAPAQQIPNNLPREPIPGLEKHPDQAQGTGRGDGASLRRDGVMWDWSAIELLTGYRNGELARQLLQWAFHRPREGPALPTRARPPSGRGQGLRPTFTGQECARLTADQYVLLPIERGLRGLIPLCPAFLPSYPAALASSLSRRRRSSLLLRLSRPGRCGSFAVLRQSLITISLGSSSAAPRFARARPIEYCAES
jgi:hypothetical protein